jgi:uncharacterized protein with GYD domain
LAADRDLLDVGGALDLVAIAEWPDEESAMALLLQSRRAGNARSEMTRAFSVEEIECILQKLP